ncbi:MAG: helix-turn-helix transcriptional regulator [Gemmatimonadales bacterium]|nr:helix-turn-helix transcriptional regulator [Gemmatimonadales bacterium]
MSGNRPRPPAARARRLVQAGGFKLTEGVHPAGTALPWHHHDTPTICFVLRGSFTESWRGGSLLCTTSTLKITPAGDRHCDQFRGPVRGLLIEADAAQVAAIRPCAGVLDERSSYQGGLISVLAWRVCQEMRATDVAAPLVVEGLLLELVALAARWQDGHHLQGSPRWLLEARDRILDQPAVRPSLGGLAEAVGVHPVTLARRFRLAYGCTVGEFVRRTRIERATRQLADSDRPLAEIAIEAGFSDQSHFSNLFRRHTGFSPSTYRRVVRAS